MYDAKMVSLSKIEVGQRILVSPVKDMKARIAGHLDDIKAREFGRPKGKDVEVHTVTEKSFEPDDWSGKVWTLTLDDGSKTEPRYGTAHVYVTEAEPVTHVEVDGVKVAEVRHDTVAEPVDVYQPVEPEKPAGVGKVLAEDLVAGLTAVLPMTADPKDALPVLSSVKFETDGDELTLVSTDRFTLGTYRMAWDGGHVDATVAEPKDLLAFAKKAKIEGYLTLTFSKESVEVASASAKATYRLYVDGEFPRWRAILPSADANDVVFGVNPQMMARFAKAGDKFTPMRVSFRSRTKPVRVQIGEAFDGLIMPVRLPEEPTETVRYVPEPRSEPEPEPEPEPQPEVDTVDDADDDDEPVAVTPITAVEKPVVTTDRCSVCKGYGVVRKYGDFKGTHYKTAKGAAEATAKGNSMPCTAVHGAKVAA